MTVSKDLEEKLWDSAEKLRGQVEQSEYKHVVLGLLFLRDASLKFKKYKKQAEEEFEENLENGEVKERLLRNKLDSENTFYVPEEARWENMKNSSRPSEKLDNAMEAIMNENERLKGRLPKRYQQVNLDNNSLNELINEFSKIDIKNEDVDDDFIGRIYEYFIKQFGLEDAQGQGSFYTPQDIVRLLVESVQPLEDSVIFDPCAGTGGMFVQSYDYVKEKENKNPMKMSFRGQESKTSQIALAEMNMFLRNMGEAAKIKEGDSLYNDRMPEISEENKLKADRTITNPPFNYSYNPDKIKADDPRFPYGLPKESNANYAFLQHMLYHTDKGGMVATVMANGALSNNQDQEIRKKIVQDDLFDVVVTLPEKLFYTVDIPVSIFIMSKGKGEYNPNHRKRQGETLFIDASDMYNEVSRSQNKLDKEHIKKISKTIRSYRGDIPEELSVEFRNSQGFSRVVETDEIEDKEYNLNPGRYIEYDTQEDYTPLKVKLPELQGKLNENFNKSRELEQKINKGLNNLHEKGDKNE